MVGDEYGRVKSTCLGAGRWQLVKKLMESGRTLRNILIESLSLRLDHHPSGNYIPFSPLSVLLAFLFWFWLGLLLTVALTLTTTFFQHPPPMATQSGAKVALLTLAFICSLDRNRPPDRNRLLHRNRSPSRNCLSVQVLSNPTFNRHLFLRVCRSKQGPKLTSIS